MNTLLKRSEHLIRQTPLKYIRGIYEKISWEARLVGIKGARGTGKTTMMLQRIKLALAPESALYVSLDDLWFANHSLLDLADELQKRGITHLFVDEVHRMKEWERQIKNIYDFYPELHIVFTGSSLLQIDHSVADLSRRCLFYELPGLSFREYLQFEDYSCEPLTLQDILYRHEEICPNITAGIDILKLFRKYLRHGFYPFYVTEGEANYLLRVRNIISTVVDYDIPAVENVEYATLLKLKRLIAMMASQTPSPLNAQNTALMLEVTKNQLVKLLSLLERADILRLLYYKSEINPKAMVKPNKVLFNNTSLLYALDHADLGRVRETFLASSLSVGHELGYPKNGDLLVDRRFVIEVGGAGKTYRQIADLPDSFIAADDIEFGLGNKIPLWLFGFLY